MMKFPLCNVGGGQMSTVTISYRITFNYGLINVWLKITSVSPSMLTHSQLGIIVEITGQKFLHG